MCKSYGTFSLFNMYCSSFFFSFSWSSIYAIFSTVFLHCSYNVFHCLSIVPFWLATLYFFFFKFLNISYSSKRHCSYNSYFFFFFPFQSSVCTFFFLLYILLYIQCFCAVHLQCHFVEPTLSFFFLNSSYSTKLSQNSLFHI